MYCEACGMKLRDTARFCTRCGQQVYVTDEPDAATPEPQRTPQPVPIPTPQPVPQPAPRPTPQPAVGTWQCYHCGTFNAAEAVCCIYCKAPKPTPPTFSGYNPPQRIVTADEWRCPRCGRVNKNYVATCACGITAVHPHTAKLPPTPLSKGTWECTKCGATNSTAVVYCHACQSHRPASVVASGHPLGDGHNTVPEQDVCGPDEWRCPSCRRVNKNYVGTCACGVTKSAAVGSRPPAGSSGTAGAAPDPDPRQTVPPEEPQPEAIKPKEPIIPSSKGTWVCPNCATFNGSAALYCKICQNRRPHQTAFHDTTTEPKPLPESESAPDPNPTPEPQIEPSVYEWRCASCGAVNSNDTSVCSCGGYRPYQLI